MPPLFTGDDEELQTLIRDHLILSYLQALSLATFTRPTYNGCIEYAGDLLLAFEKPPTDGVGLRPSSAAKIVAGASPASLAADATGS
jgi:hypothetical protein